MFVCERELYLNTERALDRWRYVHLHPPSLNLSFCTLLTIMMSSSLTSTELCKSKEHELINWLSCELKVKVSLSSSLKATHAASLVSRSDLFEAQTGFWRN